MSNNTPETPAVPGVPTTRRQLIHEAVLHLARDHHVGNYALSRALQTLDLDQLERLYDDVWETATGRPSIDRTAKTTQRHLNL